MYVKNKKTCLFDQFAFTDNGFAPSVELHHDDMERSKRDSTSFASTDINQ